MPLEENLILGCKCSKIKNKTDTDVRVEVSTAMKTEVMVFWVVTLCSDVGYHCLGGLYCLQFHCPETV
jgi:hypothetical protein